MCNLGIVFDHGPEVVGEAEERCKVAEVLGFGEIKDGADFVEIWTDPCAANDRAHKYV